MKRAKKRTFCNLDVNSISDSKNLWQIVKPLFSNRVKANTTIKLVENNKIIDDDIEISKLSEVGIALAKYRNHLSIIATIEKLEKLGKATFGFDFTLYEEMRSTIEKLSS